ncbi:hypothetical protein EDD21DRAFT_355724 [Dissophora ornata]|nr:hypothetical protein EDD21DRAFT_355724 [Dissophora ornata]
MERLKAKHRRPYARAAPCRQQRAIEAEAEGVVFLSSTGCGAIITSGPTAPAHRSSDVFSSNIHERPSSASNVQRVLNARFDQGKGERREGCGLVVEFVQKSSSCKGSSFPKRNVCIDTSVECK